MTELLSAIRARQSLAASRAVWPRVVSTAPRLRDDSRGGRRRTGGNRDVRDRPADPEPAVPGGAAV